MVLMNAARHRPAVPGIVWGDYPQARETVTRRVPRRRGCGSPGRLTQLATERRLDATISPLVVREAFVRDGPIITSWAAALACATQQLQISTGLQAHPNQLFAAAAMLDQRAVELATGEGKTVVAVLTAAAAALAGSAVHVLTVNDYLAGRDAQRFGDFFSSLGLTCRFVGCDASPDERRKGWRADVCFATARTAAFDHLRDETAHDPSHRPFLRGLCFAILDEADSLLIDEAAMPLVLSVERRSRTGMIASDIALAHAQKFEPAIDFETGAGGRRITLLPAGEVRLERITQDQHAGWLNYRHARDVIVQGLTALHVLHRDVHYLVRENGIELIESSTGRVAPGRQFAGELHRLVSAKESLPAPEATNQLTGLTWPRFFARYHHLCAMSGTLAEVRHEVRRAHGLRVQRVAPHRPNRHIEWPMRQFDSRERQFAAVVARARQLALRGRPVLIGTDSVVEARELARWFQRARVPVSALDAINDADEAASIARAGHSGRITISTQIAGRGTDIVPDDESLKSGGLHVLNLQINRSPRIDRQMHGRAARQGQPGTAEHWVRVTDTALAAEQLAPLLRLVALPLRHLHATRLSWWLIQRWWQREDRWQRSNRLRADKRNAQRLHFSTMGRH